MKKPEFPQEALTHLHNLTMQIANEAGRLMEASSIHPGHLESIKDAALDAHLLVTWIKDNLSYPKNEE